MQLFRETLTILDGTTDSNAMNLELGGSTRLVIINVFAPDTLDGTVKVHVAPHISKPYVAQQSNGQDIPIPPARATLMSPLVAGALKLVSSANESGDRVFYIVGELES